jgi:hypothetical protein
LRKALFRKILFNNYKLTKPEAKVEPDGGPPTYPTTFISSVTPMPRLFFHTEEKPADHQISTHKRA